MDVAHHWCEVARDNARQAVASDRRFPRNVFIGDWSDFFFFDADWMTAPDFVEHVKTFLGVDGGHCACLRKLDSEDANEPALFSVHEQTTADEYRGLLAGQTPGHGWLDAVERLACAPDAGEWCMYCEPNNEIAVIGFRQHGASARYASALGALGAERIDVALEEPLSYGFSQAAAVPEWRDLLVREYAAREVER
jgi:hypothetical protein